jgi:hypothetical protein
LIAKKLKEKGKTWKKTKQRNKQKKFQRYKQGETVYYSTLCCKGIRETERGLKIKNKNKK